MRHRDTCRLSCVVCRGVPRQSGTREVESRGSEWAYFGFLGLSTRHVFSYHQTCALFPLGWSDTPTHRGYKHLRTLAWTGHCRIAMTITRAAEPIHQGPYQGRTSGGRERVARTPHPPGGYAVRLWAGARAYTCVPAGPPDPRCLLCFKPVPVA